MFLIPTAELKVKLTSRLLYASFKITPRVHIFFSFILQETATEENSVSTKKPPESVAVASNETLNPNFDASSDLKLTPWEHDLHCGIFANQPSCSKTSDLNEKTGEEEEDDGDFQSQLCDQLDVGAINIPPVECEVPVVAAEDTTRSLPRLTPDRLKELLQQTEFGKKLLKTVETHCLSDDGRKLVVDIVARYHISLNRKTSSAAVEDLSEVIIELFKKETKVIVRISFVCENIIHFYCCIFFRTPITCQKAKAAATLPVNYTVGLIIYCIPSEDGMRGKSSTFHRTVTIMQIFCPKWHRH